MPEVVATLRAPEREPPTRWLWLLVALTLAGLVVAASRALELRLGDLLPESGGLRVAADFFGAALRPAFDYESEFVPEGAPSLPRYALAALGRTFLFALASLGLALVLGSGLAFLASRSWWDADAALDSGRKTWAGRMRRRIWPLINLLARGTAVLLRSIHELIWALLFLISFGLSDIAAVLAIALPFAGFFAKIFGELLEESPSAPAKTLRGLGASGPQTFLVALVTPALPDLLAYLFFRFECALRSSAVLGFFGYATIGLQIRQSFVSSYYRETWTFLWLLLIVIVALDLFSAQLRGRLHR
jgi:phosphonate transport system permease protein